jgi:peptidoglycan/LPS O-acetylase OafA/YrhL
LNLGHGLGSNGDSGLSRVHVSTAPPIDSARFLDSGDESGTAPGDRKFRPDVEGLRAVAILLVVLFHAGVPHLTGGFVGVDVFFVLSGFVITGLLLREHRSTGKNRLLAFYGRRSRRILPASTLVVILTIVASYRWLGFLTGDDTARVARSASLFLANFHFISQGTDYLASQSPPSALQNYWSLSVEEQFYIVYPTMFILTALLWKRANIRTKLVVVLTFSVIASFAWSIHQTSANSIAAFFSPFTRAWELALGGLVAAASLYLAKLPEVLARVMTWIGVVGIMTAAFTFTATTPYPGWAALIPVVSTALVVAGGTAEPRIGSEVLLRTFPFQWMGKISYSLYLWHWPILIIVAQHCRENLSLKDNLLLVLLALGLSITSYLLLENPLRHWKLLTRSPVLSVLLGASLITVAVTIASLEIAAHS